MDINKCDFKCRIVKYLRFLVTVGRGIAINPEKLKAVKQWARSKNQKETRAFLGFANFYQTVIDELFEIAAPLTKLTGKGVAFE